MLQRVAFTASETSRSFGLRCYVLRGRPWAPSHRPQRYPLGGFTCTDCGMTGADLDDMGFLGGGYVPLTRRVFSRDRHEITRTAAWEPTRRGW